MDGQIHFPDLRIEFEDIDGPTGGWLRQVHRLLALVARSSTSVGPIADRPADRH
jgi:hypothetical protein